VPRYRRHPGLGGGKVATKALQQNGKYLIVPKSTRNLEEVVPSRISRQITVSNLRRSAHHGGCPVPGRAGMKRIALLLPLVLGFAAGPAAAQDVSYNYDQDTDFSKFKSYKWVDIKSVQQVDYATTRQITFVIDAELAKKGLLKTDSDYADLYIGYQTALSRQTAWMAYRDGWGYGPGWGGGLAAIAEASIHVGELDLDMYAATEKKLVWRGAVSETVELNLNLEESEKKIEKFVEKLLKNYPPNASSADRQGELNDKRRLSGNRNRHAAAHCFSCPLGNMGVFLRVLPRNRGRPD